MNRLFVLFILLSFISCKDEVGHRSCYQIINNLDCDIKVELFTKDDYSQGDLYKVSRDGGGYREKIYKLSPQNRNFDTPGLKTSIFDSDEWDKLPDKVLTTVFDSLKIIICKGDSVELFFSIDRLRHYRYNLLIDTLGWRHTTQITDFPTMFNKNETKYETYYFTIDSLDIK